MTRIAFTAAILGVAALTLVQPAAAQQRELGPPAGAGAGLESDAPPPPPKQEDVPILPLPSRTKPTTILPEATDRTKFLLGEVEVLDVPLNQIPNYRSFMRDIVMDLSTYARGRNPKFVVVTRPGFDLLTWSRREFDLEDVKHDRTAKLAPDAIVPVGAPMRRYIQSIDGVVLNGQFCAPLRVPHDEIDAMQKQGVKMLAIDHCLNGDAAAAGIKNAISSNIVAHLDTDSDDVFAKIPQRRPSPENSANVETLNVAKNMLVMLDSRGYASKEEWLAALAATNYDVVVTDAFYKGNQALTAAEVRSLKFKQIGARRLVLARMNVGYAEDERYYWERDWKIGAPTWIKALGPERPGTYVVEFWNPAWKAIVGKYFAGIMDLGFDGVVLDGIEAYRRFEFMTPLDPAH